MLRRNMNNTDRVIRLIISITLYGALISSYPIFGSFIISMLVFIFATINLVATFSGVCLGYAAFKLSTLKK
jgi:hypothetical protein